MPQDFLHSGYINVKFVSTTTSHYEMPNLCVFSENLYFFAIIMFSYYNYKPVSFTLSVLCWTLVAEMSSRFREAEKQQQHMAIVDKAN